MANVDDLGSQNPISATSPVSDDWGLGVLGEGIRAMNLKKIFILSFALAFSIFVLFTISLGFVQFFFKKRN